MAGTDSSSKGGRKLQSSQVTVHQPWGRVSFGVCTYHAPREYEDLTVGRTGLTPQPGDSHSTSLEEDSDPEGNKVAFKEPPVVGGMLLLVLLVLLLLAEPDAALLTCLLLLL